MDAVLELDGIKLGREELSGVVTVPVYSEGEVGTAVKRSDVKDDVNEFKIFGQAESSDISFRPSPNGMLLTPKSCKQQHWRAATGRWPLEDSNDGVIQEAERRRSVTESNVAP